MRDGRSVRGPGFVVHHVVPGRSDVPRVGFATGRGLGGSVVRNRTRRRLRAAVRPLLEAMIGADVVIVARPEIVDRPTVELARALEETLAGAGLLGGSSAPGRGWTSGGTMEGQNPPSDVPEGTSS
jgi:ribonuclease P protein component